jgi:hypothetical protein
MPLLIIVEMDLWKRRRVPLFLSVLSSNFSKSARLGNVSKAASKATTISPGCKRIWHRDSPGTFQNDISG